MTEVWFRSRRSRMPRKMFCITIAASLHGLASVPGGELFEFCMADSPLRHELTGERFTIDADGYVHVPEGPGLGVTVDDEIVSRYRVN